MSGKVHNLSKVIVWRVMRESIKAYSDECGVHLVRRGSKDMLVEMMTHGLSQVLKRSWSRGISTGASYHDAIL